MFVAIGIAGVGMVLVGLTGGDGSGHVVPLGALLAIASSAWYAGYLLAGERIVKNVRPLVLGCLIATGGAIGFSAGSLALGQLQFEFGSRAWLWFALSALLSTVFAVTAVMAGMDRVGPSVAGLLTSFETPATIVYATIVFGETLSPWQWVGAALVLGGGGRGAAARAARRYRSGRMTTTRETIEAAFSGAIAAEDARAAVADAIGLLDRGEARLAEHGPDGWTVNGWLQQAILLHFRLQQMEVIEHGPFTYHDKIPLKGIDVAAGRARRAARNGAPRAPSSRPARC